MQKNQQGIKVICAYDKDSTKLIKNSTYFATGLYSYQGGDKYVSLKGTGTFRAKYFTLTNGQPLENEPLFSRHKNNEIDVKNKNYTGQYVRCRYSNSKNLKDGEIYYIEEQKIYNNYFHSDTKFKIRGIKNLITSFNFEEIPIIEQRNIKLKNLNGEKIKTGDQTRKFLLYTEKEKLIILFNLLSKVLTDLSNIELNNNIILQLIVKKGSKKYNIIEEDVIGFLENKIQESVEKIIKNI